MSEPNLTQTQAEERAALLEIDSYRIDLDVTDGAGEPGDETFRSMTTVSFTCRRPGEASWIELVAAKVHRAVLNGVELDVSAYREEDGIALPNLADENELLVEAECRYAHTGRGLHRFVDPADNEVYLHSKFEPADAKQMFACFDQPDLKATYRVSVIAPSAWNVISNTDALSVETTDSGAKKHSFAETKPLSTYLVAVVAGPYAEWRDQHDGIPLGLYCRASLAEHFDPERIFAETKQGFDFFHEKFGIRYPFGKYDQCFVPEFSSGAMENAGCITFNELYVFRSRVPQLYYDYRCNTILHEMAHMWFGDLVTMRWWNDLWLNESFATFVAYLAQVEATEYSTAWTSFNCLRKTGAYRQDQLPSTHPIMADIPDVHATEVNFDQITYAKGASVLKQLVAYVGVDNFFAGLKNYLNKYAWSNATLDDLLAALEESSGRDLSDWRDSWLLTTGANIIRPEYTTNDEGNFTSFTIQQGPARPGRGELRPHRLTVGIYDDNPSTGKLERIHRVELDVNGANTDVPELVGKPSGKLVLVDDEDLTYCTTRLDPHSLSTLSARIADIVDPLPRMLCWSAAWDMTREGEFKARDFVNLVLAGIETETESTVLFRVLSQAQVALSTYVSPEWWEKGWEQFTEQLFHFAKRAKPGSDHQLSFVNALTRSVLNKEQLTVVQQWLSGEDTLEGLNVDTDMRWRMLHALVAHGVSHEEDIAAEAARDKTGKGKEQAAQARALIPTPEAKAEAWRLVMHDDQLSLALNKVIAGSFSHPAQKDLLNSYTEKYFAEVPDMWSRRAVKHAEPAVLNLFPLWSVDHATAELTEKWLAEERPPVLRRLVSEEHSTLLRALKVQAFDAS